MALKSHGGHRNTMNTMQVRKKNPNPSTTSGAENEVSNMAKKARVDESGSSVVPEKSI